MANPVERKKQPPSEKSEKKEDEFNPGSSHPKGEDFYIAKKKNISDEDEKENRELDRFPYFIQYIINFFKSIFNLGGERNSLSPPESKIKKESNEDIVEKKIKLNKEFFIELKTPIPYRYHDDSGKFAYYPYYQLDYERE